MKKNVASNIFFKIQKYYFVFESRLIHFFQMVIFATLFRRCPRLWKSTLKMTTLFPRCLTLFSSTLKNTTLLQRCSMTLCDVATSYQPKNNVEPRLKCLLGIHACIYRKKSVIWRHQFHPSIFYGIFIVYFTTFVAPIHYNKQSVVDSRKFEGYVYFRKAIVALLF